MDSVPPVRRPAALMVNVGPEGERGAFCKWSAFILLTLMLVALSPATRAVGPYDLYQQALAFDPTYLAAVAAHNAGREDARIGKAELLPTLSYQYQIGKNESEVTQPGFLGGKTTTERSYSSYSSSFTLQQPIWDLAAWNRYRHGVAQANYADEQFRSERSDLALRLVEAYTEALYAQDQIRLSASEKRTYTDLLAMNRRMLELGEGTRTDVLETQARYDLAVAQEIEFQDALDAALRRLSSMVGQTITGSDLSVLAATFQVLPMESDDYDVWRDRALRHNPQIIAHRHALDAAQREVKEARAGHLPTVNLYASSGHQESSSEATYDQRYSTDSYGVQVSVPLYAGGGVAARARKAADNLEKQRFDGEAMKAEILNELRRQLNLFHSSRAKVKAYQFAVDSAQEAVSAMRKSVLGGERVNTDVLQAEQQLYDALRNRAEARYAYLLSWLAVREQAGVLSSADIEAVDHHFTPSPERHAVAVESALNPSRKGASKQYSVESIE